MRIGLLITLLATASVGLGVTARNQVTPAITVASEASTAPRRIVVKFHDAVTQEGAQAMSAPTDKVAEAPKGASFSALLVRHRVRAAAPVFPWHLRLKPRKEAAGDDFRAQLRKRFARRSARALKDAVVPDVAGIYRLEVGALTNSEMERTLQALRAEASVIYAEEDKRVSLRYVPNDPEYNSLHALSKIGAAQAWDTTQGQGAVVAVIDSGVDVNHPDIQANIWINPGEIADNGIDDDHNGFIDDVRGWDFVGRNSLAPVEDSNPDDRYGHGTHVAGTIAATGDNNVGVVGVAWKAKVMALKGIADDGYGYDSYLAKAIIYAVDNGADVINASWGGEDSATHALSDAIDYAHAMGVIFVAAAGNDSGPVENFYPANQAHVIAVASLSTFDALSSFSNYGSKIDLCAPGENILSLQAGSAGYTRKEGTSMAAPHVSGVAALVIARHPEYTIDQVRQALCRSAYDLGPLGKDASFGYGRIDAAKAVLMDNVLAAAIHSPVAETPIKGITALQGTAGGPGFVRYTLDYGAGTNPADWMVLRESAVSVVSAELGIFDPSHLPDGIYTVRLRVFDASGAVFTDQIQIRVRYLQITAPKPALKPQFTTVVKSGATVEISGSADGPSFVRYRLDWAPGVDATSGWSTMGLVLTGGGAAPVVDGVLANWMLPETLQGDYTLRLTVENAGFTSMATMALYAEPALLSNGWPKFIGPAYSEYGAQPVRLADGSVRLLLRTALTADLFGGSPKQRWLYSLALDGTMLTTQLEYSSQHQPSVGDLDGVPGDEVVMGDGFTLKLFTPTLELIRTIMPTGPQRVFIEDQPMLADLDGDGRMEIIAPARDNGTGSANSFRYSGALYVYRGDGSLYSNNYPVAIRSPRTSAGDYSAVLVTVADLEGDGQKEIIMAVETDDYSSYTLLVFNADGTPRAGWSAPSFAGQVQKLIAADFNHDGTTELFTATYNLATNQYQLRVLASNGTTRPGWPVIQPADNIGVAIGDIDRDGRMEIVVTSIRNMSIWNAQGQPWCPDRPSGDQYTPPLLADIDSDGYPEIIVGTYPARGERWIKCFKAANGEQLAAWKLFGLEERQLARGIPLVGDFNGDGLTDIVVQLPLIEGGGESGLLINSGLTCLTTDMRFNAAASDWPSGLHDPQNSNSIPTAELWPQAITFPPLSNRSYGPAPITLTAVANSGLPVAFTIVSGPATLSGNTLTLTGLGMVTVRAAQAGNTTYTAAVPVERTFMVTSSFSWWALGCFNVQERADATISGVSADPDRDGLSNLMEYALGLDPKIADGSGLMEVRMTENGWACTYIRPSNRSDIVYAVEASSNLENWSGAFVSSALISSIEGDEIWEAQVPLFYGETVFFRLRVTVP